MYLIYLHLSGGGQIENCRFSSYRNVKGYFMHFYIEHTLQYDIDYSIYEFIRKKKINTIFNLRQIISPLLHAAVMEQKILNRGLKLAQNRSKNIII